MTISEWEQANRDSIDRRRALMEAERDSKPNSYEVEMHKRSIGVTKAAIEIAKVRESVEYLVGFRHDTKSYPVYMAAGERMLIRGFLTDEVIELLRSMYDAAQIDADAERERLEQDRQRNDSKPSSTNMTWER